MHGCAPSYLWRLLVRLIKVHVLSAKKHLQHSKHEKARLALLAYTPYHKSKVSNNVIAAESVQIFTIQLKTSLYNEQIEIGNMTIDMRARARVCVCVELSYNPYVIYFQSIYLTDLSRRNPALRQLASGKSTRIWNTGVCSV